MARDFVRASSQYLELGGLGISLPFSIAMLVKSSSISSTDMYFTAQQANQKRYYSVGVNTSGVVLIEHEHASSNYAGAQINPGISVGTWYWICASWDTTSARHGWLDGGSKASETATNVTEITVTQVTVARRHWNPSSTWYADMGIQALAIWSAAMTDAEASRVGSKRIHPVLAKPANLIDYFDFTRSLTGIKGNVFTANNGPTIVANSGKLIQIPSSLAKEAKTSITLINVSEAISLLESSIINNSLAISENLKTLESSGPQAQVISLENLRITEALNSAIAASISEILKSNESLSSQTSVSSNEVLDFTEVLQLSGALNISETVNTSEASSISNLLTVTEPVSLTETLNVLTAQLKTVLETLKLGESFTVNSDISSTEILNLAESLVNSGIVNLSETLTLNELVNVLTAQLKVVVETLNLPETLAVGCSATLNEVIQFSELLSSSNVLTVLENLQYSENINVLTGALIVLNEIVNFSENVSNLTISTSVLENLTVNEILSSSNSLNILENISVTENFIKAVLVAVSETINLSESLIKFTATLITVQEFIKTNENVGPIAVSLTITDLVKETSAISIANILTVLQTIGATEITTKFDTTNLGLTVTFLLENRPSTFLLEDRYKQ